MLLRLAILLLSALPLSRACLRLATLRLALAAANFCMFRKILDFRAEPEGSLSLLRYLAAGISLYPTLFLM